MQINLVQKITEQPLIIETEHNDPDEAISIEYIGEQNAIADFIRATEGNMATMDISLILIQLPIWTCRR